MKSKNIYSILPTFVFWEKSINTFQDGSYSKNSSCGHTIRKDWLFCPYCGRKVISKGIWDE